MKITKRKFFMGLLLATLAAGAGTVAMANVLHVKHELENAIR